MVKVGDKAKTLSGNTVVITKDLGGDLFECRTDHPTTNDFGCDGSKVLLRAENLEPEERDTTFVGNTGSVDVDILIYEEPLFRLAPGEALQFKPKGPVRFRTNNEGSVGQLRVRKNLTEQEAYEEFCSWYRQGGHHAQKTK